MTIESETAVIYSDSEKFLRISINFQSNYTEIFTITVYKGCLPIESSSIEDNGASEWLSPLEMDGPGTGVGNGVGVSAA